jgi:protein-tyrosine phosphatase
MVQLDILEVPGRHPVVMSAHPLEGAPMNEDLPGILRNYIAELKNLDIGTITVLLPEEEIIGNYEGTDLLREYNLAGFKVIHFPLENFSTPNSIDVFHNLMEHISAYLKITKVLIHCKTGCGRTAMVAAGILIRLKHSAPKAITAVHAARPSSRLTVNQIQFLREYQRYLL